MSKYLINVKENEDFGEPGHAQFRDFGSIFQDVYGVLNEISASQHIFDMLGCCSPKGESEREEDTEPPLPLPPHCEQRGRQRARAGARACAHTWEIHIPELRPGPIRDRLGPEKGAQGGSQSANMC